LARVVPLQTQEPIKVVPKVEVIVAAAPEKKEQKQEAIASTTPRVTFMEPVAYQPRGPVITYLPRPHLQQWLPPNWQYRIAPYANNNLRQSIPRPLVSPRPLVVPRPLVTPRPYL
jgi:hypothetical protein